MDRRFRLQFSCSPEERSEALKLGFGKPSVEGSTWRLALLCLALLLVLAAAVTALALSFSAPYRTYIVGASILFFPLSYVFVRRSNRHAGTARVEVSSEGFRLGDDKSELFLTWDKFLRYVESDGLFVLVPRSMQLVCIIPKRACADPAMIDDLRALLEKSIAPSFGSASPPGSSDVGIRLRYSYRDSLAYAIVSWRAWICTLVVVGIFVFAFVSTSGRPPPNAVHSTPVVLLMTSPFILVMLIMGPAILSRVTYREWRKAGDKQLSIGEDGVRTSDPEGEVLLHWDGLASYRETRTLFIIAAGRFGTGARVVPKRLMGDSGDVERVRLLLEAKLRRSLWVC